ncbi:hypothetical protein HDV05_008172 [Chytridiales sp. JEL 0842]|nr:hypothetical protein HDV05_008172 [Chytridiales sp. JEL 0842]
MTNSKPTVTGIKVNPAIEITRNTTEYTCPKTLESANGHWRGECMETTCKPVTKVIYRGKTYMVLTCQWKFYLNRMLHIPDLIREVANRDIPIAPTHIHPVLKYPAQPIEFLMSYLRQMVIFIKYKDFTYVLNGFITEAWNGTETLGICQCFNCPRAYSDRINIMLAALRVIGLYMVVTPMWAMILYLALTPLDHSGASTLQAPRILSQFCFFLVTRAAALSLFQIPLQGKQADRKRLMAYYLAGADPVAGILPNILIAIFNIRTQFHHIIAYFTDFWILLLAMASTGSAYADVSIAANRCDASMCYLTASEVAWVVVCLLLALFVFSTYVTPVEILARHAFSEAAGTATGFEFADVMRFYTSRLVRVEEGVAHLSMVGVPRSSRDKDGVGRRRWTKGWVVPDSYITKKTTTGDTVCGGYDDQCLEKGAGKDVEGNSITRGKDNNTTRIDICISSEVSESPQTSNDSFSPYEVVQETKTLLSGICSNSSSSSITKREYTCPKVIKTPYVHAYCLEPRCIAPLEIPNPEDPTKSYTLLKCQYLLRAASPKRSLNPLSQNPMFHNAYLHLQQTGYSLRHFHMDWPRPVGPIEMLFRDIISQTTLAFNPKLNSYVQHASFNSTLDTERLGTCECFVCLQLYVKRRLICMTQPFVRLLMFLGTFYLLAVVLFMVITSPSKMPYSSTESSSLTVAAIRAFRWGNIYGTFTVNKLAFQGLFFGLTRGSTFAVASLYLTTETSKSRKMAILLATTDPISGILYKLFKSFSQFSKNKADILSLFSDFWLLVALVASLGASYADVTVSASSCNESMCSVTPLELVLIVMGVMYAVLIAFLFAHPIQILACHAFSEAAGTCGGYNLGHVMAYYTNQLRKVSDKEAHYAIVKAGECKGVTLVDAFMPKFTTLGQRIR